MRLKRVVWVLLILLVAAPVVAHVPDLYASVHFNSAHPDFGLLPRRMMIPYRGEHYSRTDSRDYSQDPPDGPTVEEFGGSLYESEEWDKVHRDQLLKRADKQQNAGDWRGAAQSLWQVGRRFGWRRGIRDRYSVLSRVAAMPAPMPEGVARALRLYIRGMDLIQSKLIKPDAAKTFGEAADVPGCGFIRDHALYQAASVRYELKDWPGAIGAYDRLLQSNPSTELREPTLMMIARCALLPKNAKDCDPKAARRALDELERKYPNGRFKAKILGLRGKLYLLIGQFGEAIHCYLKADDLESVGIMRGMINPQERGRVDVQLFAGYLRRMDRPNPDVFERSVVMIDRIRKRLAPTDAYRFSRKLLADPDLISAYLYYRLYHTTLHKGDFEHLTSLAQHLLHRRPATTLPPAIRTRLAELYYHKRDWRSALSWADGALGTSVDPTGRALYVRGACLHKLGRAREALAAFNSLLARYPKSGLRRAARENVALLYEAVGDRARALDQYFELDYSEDIAFMIDIRMSIPELESYLRTRPELTIVEDNGDEEYVPGSLGKMRRKPPVRYPRSDLLAYSIGIRYLRKERWADARRWLTMAHRRYGRLQGTHRHWFDRAESDPLKALNALEPLHRAIRTARSDNARAAAMYRYARYYYTHSDELLYNSALWRGERAIAFQFFWHDGVASKQDEAAVKVHHYEHEIYARALNICVELARKYPRSPYAPKALYRAACAERKLASFNDWWRNDNKRQNHFFAAARLMKRLGRLYPHDPLAGPAEKFGLVFRSEGSGDRWD